jgi:hypothetical protein
VKPFEDLQDQEHSALLLVRHLKRRNPGLNPSKLTGRLHVRQRMNGVEVSVPQDLLF